MGTFCAAKHEECGRSLVSDYLVCETRCENLRKQRAALQPSLASCGMGFVVHTWQPDIGGHRVACPQIPLSPDLWADPVSTTGGFWGEPSRLL